MGDKKPVREYSLPEGFRFDVPSRDASAIADALRSGYLVLVYPREGECLVEWTVYNEDDPNPYYASQDGMKTSVGLCKLFDLGTENKKLSALRLVLDSGFEAYLVPHPSWAGVRTFEIVHFMHESD